VTVVLATEDYNVITDTMTVSRATGLAIVQYLSRDVVVSLILRLILRNFVVDASQYIDRIVSLQLTEPDRTGTSYRVCPSRARVQCARSGDK